MTARIESLKRLEAILENFLGRAVELEINNLNNISRIDSLDEIARQSLKGRLVNQQLGNWFARNRDYLDSERLKETEVETIANLLSEIKKGLDSSDPESRKLADEIERWKDKGIVPKRKLILKMKPAVGGMSITEKFADYLGREKEILEQEEYSQEHLLSILDDILKSAEAKEDHIFIHLAGSIIYFLRMNGYKVSPYVKRLKQIEKERLGIAYAE